MDATVQDPKTRRKISIPDNDCEVSLDFNQANERKAGVTGYIIYLFLGILFGILLIKSEVVSWFRIQEMFRLQSFHMFGVIGSAVVVGMLSVWIIRKANIKALNGKHIVIPVKKFNRGNIYGGLLFGFGWAITGACPGPLFAQIGNGASVIIITLLSAIAGTWVYGRFRNSLPH
jgi:uncharacterized membrane protein YedE/YeeE